MNTQSYLFEIKESLPDGIYLELMNKLKLDFDNPPQHKVKMVPYKKNELLMLIGQKSVNWSNRDLILAQVAKYNMVNLKNWCNTNGVPIEREVQ